MNLHAAEKLFADAARQEDRWPAALDPNFARPDDRSLFSLIDFACRFSSLVHYYSPENQIDGDWVEFFTGDPFITMASIVATDLHGADRRMARLEQRTRAASSRAKPATFRALLDAALELPRQSNRWLRGLSSPLAYEANLPLRSALESSVRYSLRTSLRRMIHGNPFRLEYPEFTGAWLTYEGGAEPSIYTGGSVVEQIDAALPLIRPLWQPFPDAIAEWAAIARPQLSKAFEGDTAHQPHVALLVAFARLFSTVQASINAVPARRTDFYFRRILRERHRAAVPDTVHVAFACASEREPAGILVPTGTLLSAGNDAAGREIVFESKDDVRVTSAALRKVHTLRVVSGPVASDIDHVVTERVLGRQLSPQPATPGGWPAFGGPGDVPAEVGFAINSHALELAGGERTVTLTFRYDLGTGCTAVLTKLSAATGLTHESLLERVLQQAFVLSVSTAAGWVRVPDYSVRPLAADGDGTFGLRFALSTDAPAVTSFSDSRVASATAAVRADLRQERIGVEGPRGAVSIYPLSVLDGVAVSRVTVRVDVIALPGMRVANVNGEMDQSRPFPVLGAVPIVGSPLRIGHAELFSKSVSRLALHVRWFDLPKHDTGFHGYFRGYVLDSDGVVRDGLFDNQVFRATVGIERPGTWTIEKAVAADGFCLFRTLGQIGPMPGKDDELASETSIENLSVRPLPPPSADYDPADGRIRLELTGPDYAFGHTLYQQNMMRAATVTGPTETACDAACREQYAVLAETRRQLDALFKDLRRKRPLAAAVQAASPRFLAQLPGRGLNVAYRKLTRSLPAYAARQQDAPPRTASVISTYYADAGVAEPSPLPLLDRRAARQRVGAIFERSLRALLNEAGVCLASCIFEWKEGMPPQEWRSLQQRLTDAGALQGSARLRSLRELHTRLTRTDRSGDGEPARELLARSEAMLQAASCVDDCSAGAVDEAGWNYWRSLSANLKKCLEALQTLYDRGVQRCKDASLRPGTRPLPNPPFVPQAESVSIDYSATGIATFAHLLPYEGHSRPTTDPITLLPRFAGSGSLYLGFSDGATTPALGLHVQIGQAASAWSPATRVAWDALVENRWVGLDIAPSGDATRGLQRSGILNLPVPPGDVGMSTLLPAGYRWFRASVSGDTDAFPPIIAILPHAVTAVRRVSDTTAADLGRALPPHAVRAIVKPIRGIGPVVQPWASFGGRPPESDRELQTRISERLRHKDRAILGWDYERLALERFPEIWMARVIPASPKGAGRHGSTGPGHVRVVVVPGPQ